MKIIDSILCLAVLAFSFSSPAIRSVGNGGGESEMIALQQFESLSVWEKFCSENTSLCFGDSKEGSEILRALQNVQAKYAVLNLDFVNATDFQKPFENHTLLLTHEEIYEDEQAPKSRLEVFQRVLLRYLQIENPEAQVSKTLELAPDVTLHANGFSAILHSDCGDYLVFLNGTENLHLMVQELFHTNSYVAKSAIEDGYLISTAAGIYELHLQWDLAGHHLSLRKNIYYAD